MAPSIRVGVGAWVASTAPSGGHAAGTQWTPGRISGWVASVGPVPDVDAAGTEWILTNLSGWHGGVGIRSAAVDYLQGDGAMAGPVRLTARTVTIEGAALAISEASLLGAMDILDALLTGATRTSLVIVDEVARGVCRQAGVHLAGPTMVKRTGRMSMDFSVSLLAPDPTRYPVPTL